MKIFKKVNIFTILILLVLTAEVSAQTIEVLVRGDIDRTEYLRSRRDNGEYYVSAKDFSEILGVNIFNEENLGKTVLYLEGSQVTFTAGNPFVTVGARIFQLPVEPR